MRKIIRKETKKQINYNLLCVVLYLVFVSCDRFIFKNEILREIYVFCVCLCILMTCVSLVFVSLKNMCCFIKP